MPLRALNQAQVDEFRAKGVLTVENAVTSEQLAALRAEFAGWVEESRGQSESYGKAVDGRPRFDLEASHSAAKPALRRVNAPVDVSDVYREVARDSRMVDMVADLIGPDLRYHHSKINSKLPGTKTEVKWHQDFPFTPHSNPDLVTALLMVDEVTEENGPLEVVPGSHVGPIHSLWHDGHFTGAVAEDIAADFQKRAVKCFGPAGSVCLMHTRLAHGSAPNLSQQPRTLSITVYAAADAAACSPNPVPSTLDGEIVRGTEPNRIRCEAYEVEIPEYPRGASFFLQQEAS
ncbi:phytanoyl-CoA dioxygenase family protein [Pelagibius sp. Alg239-R121]|uniref:phytanoyl-CoA dioxygenase family protein n=1 Tax=Pelagibius sp. Alg239-R121 TaxID=2993448 RepID=UPI0024A7A2F0|nr:phytanoyl-CoA dioxygenase family protein [Pelagibius sp. Alg239-R121]